MTSLSSTSDAVTLEDYKLAVAEDHKIVIKGFSQGDGENIEGRLYKPNGEGPFPALVALHGAGGIFPYQLWWAKEISKNGFVVLSVDHYCSRGYLCEHTTDDTDENRGEIMRDWQQVSIKQRLFDAMGAYHYLSSQSYIKPSQIGLIGWSFGGSTALFAQKLAEKIPLPNRGFKGSIAFYPNLMHIQKARPWRHSGSIKQPTLILYGKEDQLESADSYSKLLKSDEAKVLRVMGLDGATRKFDEIGPLRTKYHPAIGDFTKAFHEPALDKAIAEINKFLALHFN